MQRKELQQITRRAVIVGGTTAVASIAIASHAESQNSQAVAQQPRTRERAKPSRVILSQSLPAATPDGNSRCGALLLRQGSQYRVKFIQECRLCTKSGVEPQNFLEIINSAVFQSPVYENYGTLIAQSRYEPAGFKLELGLKDIGLVLDPAATAQVPMPLASLLRDHFLSAVAHGQGEIDWSGLGRVSADNAGLSD